MNILMASSEVVPLAKTGGLADVCGALPVELIRQGHQVSLIMPYFSQVKESGCPIQSLGVKFEIPIGKKMVAGEFLKTELPDSNVTVYLVGQDEYYHRDGLYNSDGVDYKDNCERFIFYCRAVMEAIELLELEVDVIHANDWPTGLIPAYLELEYRGIPRYENIASLFTIHNLDYQGNFWHWDMLLTGLDWKYFNWQQMEFHGNLSMMKTGLVFSNSINTVSPRYAQEIQSAPLGRNLEGVLQQRSEVLSGILNGVDYKLWNPQTDPSLAANFGPDDFQKGKPVCKKALQKEVGLPQQAEVPLIGIVGRLADQKGFDLLAEVMQKWMTTQPAQWVILGTGEKKYHELLENLATRFPKKVALSLQFSEKLAHQIEAGSDIFAMPSRFEPCGLNQMYSLKYGTLPVVRATGGLADTIVHASPQNIADGTANGFCFRDYSTFALSEQLQNACEMYQNQRKTWNQLVRYAMQQDWSWSRSASEYVKLYETTLARRKNKLSVG